MTLLFWERLTSDVGISKGIISDKEPKFASEFCTQLMGSMGTRMQFPTASHPMSDGLCEREIKTLKDIIRGSCAFELEFKYRYGYPNDWKPLSLEFEIA